MKKLFNTAARAYAKCLKLLVLDHMGHYTNPLRRMESMSSDFLDFGLSPLIKD